MISGSAAVASSENIFTLPTPAAIVAISASWRPSRPTVTAPTGVHVDEAHFLAAAPHVIGDDGRVGDGAGVRHREHGGVPAESRSRRTGVDGLGVLAARLPQVRVHVDKKPGSRIWRRSR